MEICRWLFTYGFVYAFFQVLVAFIPGHFAGPVSGADAFDFLTPLVVIPVALAVFFKLRKAGAAEGGASSLASKWAIVFFVLGLIFYVEGHGLHLSANSIDRLLAGQEDTALHQSVYIYDEVISHFIWDSGVLIIAVGLILAGTRVHLPRLSLSRWVFLAAGAAFFGFSYTVNGIEGQTVVLTFPAAGLMSLVCFWIYGRGRKRREHNVTALFFLIGFILAVLLFAYWGIAHRGFPEFSALGWI